MKIPTSDTLLRAHKSPSSQAALCLSKCCQSNMELPVNSDETIIRIVARDVPLPVIGYICYAIICTLVTLFE